jgi:hypothetical protein
MRDTERLERVLDLVRTLLAPTPLGKGPIRMEAWSQDVWTEPQRDAYADLCQEAGLDLGPEMPEEVQTSPKKAPPHVDWFGDEDEPL